MKLLDVVALIKDVPETRIMGAGAYDCRVSGPGPHHRTTSSGFRCATCRIVS
jgi:hypothetical protein